MFTQCLLYREIDLLYVHTYIIYNNKVKMQFKTNLEETKEKTFCIFHYYDAAIFSEIRKIVIIS